MKKVLAILLATLMIVACFAGCSKTKTEHTGDLGYIEGKDKMVIGVTVYKPMNYKDANDNWTGFDTEFAQAVAKKLGVEAEFVIIDWDTKWESLRSKKIDCVWNGMTITDEAKENASVTNAYVINAQVVVMKEDKLANYKDAASLKGVTFAVESGSAGEDIAKEQGYNYKGYTAQSDALLAVKTNKADACIIDITMANAMTGKGTDYTDLGIGVTLTSEEYGIACRKNSNLVDAINKAMTELKEDGTLDKLAKKYNVTLA